MRRKIAPTITVYTARSRPILGLSNQCYPHRVLRRIRQRALRMALMRVSKTSHSHQESLDKIFRSTQMPRRLSIATCSRVRLVRPSKTTKPIRCSHLRYRAVIVNPLPRRAVLASPTSSLALRRSLTEEFSSAISRVVASATFNGQFPLSVEDKRVAPNRLTLQVQSLCVCCSKSKRESPSETQAQAT